MQTRRNCRDPGGRRDRALVVGAGVAEFEAGAVFVAQQQVVAELRPGAEAVLPGGFSGLESEVEVGVAGMSTTW